jgi:hypothetical protein
VSIAERQGLRPGAQTTARGDNRHPSRRIGIAAALLATTIALPAMADPPPSASSAPSPPPVATLAGDPDPFREEPPEAKPDPAAAPVQAVPPIQTAPLPPPAPYPVTWGVVTAPVGQPAEPPKPQRDKGLIAGGVILTTLGGAGLVTGLVLCLTAIAQGVTSSPKWQGTLGGGVASVGLGGLSLGIGIPLIRAGARKAKPEPPPAYVWLAAGTVSLTF